MPRRERRQIKTMRERKKPTGVSEAVEPSSIGRGGMPGSELMPASNAKDWVKEKIKKYGNKGYK